MTTQSQVNKRIFIINTSENHLYFININAPIYPAVSNELFSECVSTAPPAGNASELPKQSLRGFNLTVYTLFLIADVIMNNPMKR